MWIAHNALLLMGLIAWTRFDEIGVKVSYIIGL